MAKKNYSSEKHQYIALVLIVLVVAIAALIVTVKLGKSVESPNIIGDAKYAGRGECDSMIRTCIRQDYYGLATPLDYSSSCGGGVLYNIQCRYSGAEDSDWKWWGYCCNGRVPVI
jgi:hypothetical protein